MYALKEKRSIELNPDLAKHYLAKNTFHSQRAFRTRHAGELAEKIKRGLWIGAQIVFAELGGVTYLINGQHVLDAVIQSKKEIDAELRIYVCENKHDLSLLFRQFDVGRIRTTPERLRVEADAQGVTWPLPLLSKIAAAARLERFGPYAASHSARGSHQWARGTNEEEKITLWTEYMPESRFVVNVCTGAISIKKAEHVAQKPVIAMMMRTFRVDQASANIFWRDVRDGGMLTQDSAPFQLREFLIENIKRSKRGSIYKKYPDLIVMSRCAIAWNDYRKGKRNRKQWKFHDPTKLI